MRYNGRMGIKMVSLSKTHGNLGSMTFACDLVHFGQDCVHEQSYKHNNFIIYIFQVILSLSTVVFNSRDR